MSTNRPVQRAPAAHDRVNPCFEFQKSGHCKFGTRCKFSHGPIPRDKPGQSASGNPSHRSSGGGSGRNDGKLKEWKRLLNKDNPTSQPSLETTQRFFQLALELMEGDLGASQEVVKLLVSEAGLSFIRILTDRHLATTTVLLNLWKNAVKPLFQLVTHPRLIDSAVLEQEVSTLFNFLFGVGGARVSRLFAYVARLIESWSDHTTSQLSKMEAVELSLAILSKMMDFNTTTIVNAEFTELVAPFSNYLKDTSTSQNEASTMETSDGFSRLQASRYLDYIHRRLQAGSEINTLAGASTTATPVFREQFILRRDLPGNLSADGPRHDNDHEEIPKIKILPTYEEIVSPRAEYLPKTDPSEWHLDGILGRLDREFRLIREDTVGQLREAVREILEAMRNTGNIRRTLKSNGARTVFYESPTPVHVQINRDEGLQLTVRCSQIANVREMDTDERRYWWSHSKRLQPGSLVCILDATGSVLFCVVSESTIRSLDDKRARREKDDDNENSAENALTLSENKEYLYVKLHLVDPGPREIGQTLRWYQPAESVPCRYLVEFPGVLLASFKYTLSALQHMYKQPNVPFHHLLAPSRETTSDNKIVRPPQYARAGGFVFDAQCLTRSKKEFGLSMANLPVPEVVESETTLDPTQSAALLDTLSRELSLIQGPPGTGKSYTGEKIIKLLLANKEKARLGPVLCVCYTNHALDQLLEHLIDDGIKNIIRVGSRSKSERLQDLNLRVVARQFERTKTEKSSLYKAEQKIRDLILDGTDAIKSIEISQKWPSVKAFLAENYPQHHKELFGDVAETEGEWQKVKRKPQQVLEKWLRGGISQPTPPRDLEILKLTQTTMMSMEERRNLHLHWLKRIRDSIIGNLINIHRDFAKMTEQRNRLRGDVDLRCLQEASVIGVTTTGLARQLDVLRKLRCKVMVCEEAGEVLEAHILTALLPSVEHAILIGDHLQLRPQIQNYDLQSVNPRGEKYSLDVSLFERLVQSPVHDSETGSSYIPLSVLETQRRMHPSIAELVRQTLYPALKDAPKVSEYPGVVGMKKRLFWMHHEHPEAGCGSSTNSQVSQDPVGTSHSNDFEIEMTAALVSHLVRQGEYGKEDIAVITPYLGQLQKLRRRMQGMFEVCLNDRDLDDVEALEDHTSTGDVLRRSGGLNPGVAKTTLLNSVRIATVDNFQGEEAKVVVICLVRSNPQSNCGFLKTSNRINVLLSRAQHGMFIIGNAKTYSSVSMWSDVIGMLTKGDNFGPAFELQCPRHPDTALQVSNPDQFMQYSPESGCRLSCDKRLRCGHSCTGRCHSQLLHDAVKCLTDCPRPLRGGCDHPCPRRCGDPCPEKCQVPLKNLDLDLPCGHRIQSAKCWETKNLASIKCVVTVTRTIPGCNHELQMKCHEDVTVPSYLCKARCGRSWSTCRHTCSLPCHQCRQRKKGESPKDTVVDSAHAPCLAPCGRSYTNCRHVCQQTCHGVTNRPCGPCKRPCEVRCGHSKCDKECNEPCTPCAEQTCHSSCPHGGCTMPCAAPCNWVPCSQRCGKLLDCSHQCPSVCGERCPPKSYCQECSSETVKSTCVDVLEMREYREINLNTEPCIFPDCGHFLTFTSMDGQMNMSGHYIIGSSGFPAAISKASKPFSMDQTEPIRVCPSCRGSLRNIARYGRIVRRGMLDEATKKFIAGSNEKYLTLAKALVAEQEMLAKLKVEEPIIVVAKPGPPGPQIPGYTQPRLSREDQMRILSELSRPNASTNSGKLTKERGRRRKGRYWTAAELWKTIITFVGQVRKEEQPFQRVADLVKHGNRLRRQLEQAQGARDPGNIVTDAEGPGSSPGQAGAFHFDESVIQVKGYLLATSLLLKCEVMVFDDFIRLVSEGKVNMLGSAAAGTADGTLAELSLRLDMGTYLQACEKLINLAKDTKHPKEQVQGHLYAGRFCGFAKVLGGSEVMNSANSDRTTDPSSSELAKHRDRFRELGLNHLAQARSIINQYPSTVLPPSTVEGEMEAVKRFLKSGTFYDTVTAEEMRAVYEAMAGEFRGTGHWYTCTNNHPFTVGECGMPMEQARCPECGAPVGGQNHVPVQGVRRDEHMDEIARGVRQMMV